MRIGNSAAINAQSNTVGDNKVRTTARPAAHDDGIRVDDLERNTSSAVF